MSEHEVDTSGPSIEEELAAMEAANNEAHTAPLAGEEEEAERPEWLPEKFKTPEDMAKAYSELEKKNSAGEGEEPANEPANEGDREADEAAEQAVEAAGLDMDALSAEYETGGKLSDESMAKLKAQGITEDMVSMYISGVQAQAEAAKSELLGTVGSEEAYSEMISWASDTLSEADIDAYNGALETGNPGVIKMAVENLHMKYVAANGSEPKVELAGKPAGQSLSVYTSVQEVTKDMNNPEYARDPDFRKKVEEKIARSNY